MRNRRAVEDSVVDVITTVVIDQPRSLVADYVAEPSNMPKWNVGVRSVKWKTPPPIGVGSHIAFSTHFLGRRLAFIYEVVEFVAGELLVMRVADGPFVMETTYSWESEGENRTKMMLRNRGCPRGFSKVLRPLLPAALRRANRNDLARLKEILERG